MITSGGNRNPVKPDCGDGPRRGWRRIGTVCSTSPSTDATDPTVSPGARAHYDRRKTTGDRHVAAQRNLFNRLIGCLHHCLETRQHYNESIAFPTTTTISQRTAA
jgi:hypothetical protein